MVYLHRRILEAAQIQGKEPTQSWFTAAADLALAWPALPGGTGRSQLPILGSGCTQARTTLGQVGACSWRLWLELSWSRARKGLRALHIMDLGEVVCTNSWTVSNSLELTALSSHPTPCHSRPIFQGTGVGRQC